MLVRQLVGRRAFFAVFLVLIAGPFVLLAMLLNVVTLGRFLKWLLPSIDDDRNREGEELPRQFQKTCPRVGIADLREAEKLMQCSICLGDLCARPAEAPADAPVEAVAAAAAETPQEPAHDAGAKKKKKSSDGAEVAAASADRPPEDPADDSGAKKKSTDGAEPQCSGAAKAGTVERAEPEEVDEGRTTEPPFHRRLLFLRRLRCGHIYHSACIDPWIVQGKRCAVCRQPAAHG